MSVATAPQSSAAQSSVAPSAGLLRCVPVPRSDLPYDDELEPARRGQVALDRGYGTRRPAHGRDVRAVVADEDDDQGTLALVFVLSSGLPATPEQQRGHARSGSRRGDADRVLQTAGCTQADEQADDDDDREFAPQPTPRALLPEPRGWSARLVQALVEVLSGDRPASQLVRWTTQDVYTCVQRRVEHRHVEHRHVAGESGPPSHRRAPRRAVVRSVHVSEPVDGVAEVCATVQRGLRATAVALRLEGVDGRWQCTALEVC